MPYKCACKQEFENRNALSAHIRWTKEGEHSSLGYFDPNTGEHLAKGPKVKKPSSKEEKPPAPRTSTQIAAVTAPAPAATTFRLGSTSIEIDPKKLYESWILYEDIKQKCGLKDDFSTSLLDAMGIVWRLLTTKPKVVKIDVVEVSSMEAEHG